MFARRWIRAGAVLLALFGMLAVPAAGDGEASLASQIRIAEVAVQIDEEAFVDWNRPSTAIFQIQNDIIRQVFRSAALEGAQAAATGDRPAVLSINITYFDILSDIEQLFCCARNEVMADYLLVDAQTGEVLAGVEKLDFDHIGRGGFLALIDRNSGEDQLSRLFDMIAMGTADWLAGGG